MTRSTRITAWIRWTRGTVLVTLAGALPDWILQVALHVVHRGPAT
ncbi:MAG: hypothetical protein R3E10_18955 [Gemmatimonadota bacterium]